MMYRHQAITWARWGIAILTIAGAAPASVRAAVLPAPADNSDFVGPPAPTDVSAPAESPAPAEVKPRLELWVPSAHRLLQEADRAHSGVFLAFARELVLELAGNNTEGIGEEEIRIIAEQLVSWPDTGIVFATYAPDYEGRLRWLARIDWPATMVEARLRDLLETELAREMLRGITLVKRDGGAIDLRLADRSLLCIRSEGGASLLSSHDDSKLPSLIYRGPEEPDQAEPSLVTCRLNLAQTEQDSGATFLSSFSAFNDVEYIARVDDTGEWLESIAIHWPPISGVGAKVFFGRVKQSFFAPAEAFGSLAMNSIMVPEWSNPCWASGPRSWRMARVALR